MRKQSVQSGYILDNGSCRKKKSCSDINSSYKSSSSSSYSCGTGYYATAHGQDEYGYYCYTCNQQSCAKINSSYISAAESCPNSQSELVYCAGYFNTQKKIYAGISGSDGRCYYCQTKTCQELSQELEDDYDYISTARGASYKYYSDFIFTDKNGNACYYNDAKCAAGGYEESCDDYCEDNESAYATKADLYDCVGGRTCYSCFCELKTCSAMGGQTSACSKKQNYVLTQTTKDSSDGTCYFCRYGACPNYTYTYSYEGCDNGSQYNRAYTYTSAQASQLDSSLYDCSSSCTRRISAVTASSSVTAPTCTAPLPVGLKVTRYKCKLKSCSDMGYMTEAEADIDYTVQKLVDVGVSGSDGKCYTYRWKTCNEMDSSYHESCASGYWVVTTGEYDGAGHTPCYLCMKPDSATCSMNTIQQRNNCSTFYRNPKYSSLSVSNKTCICIPKEQTLVTQGSW